MPRVLHFFKPANLTSLVLGLWCAPYAYAMQSQQTPGTQLDPYFVQALKRPKMPIVALVIKPKPQYPVTLLTQVPAHTTNQVVLAQTHSYNQHNSSLQDDSMQIDNDGDNEMDLKPDQDDDMQE